MVGRGGSGRGEPDRAGFRPDSDPSPASSLVDHIKTWAVAPRPIDKFRAAEIASFRANRRHAVDIPGGRTPETCPAGRPRPRPCWWSPIRPAGLPVAVPALGWSPSWRTMPPMGEGRGRYCSRGNHHQDEEPSLNDGQICWRLSRHLHSPTGPPHESDVWPLWFPCALSVDDSAPPPSSETFGSRLSKAPDPTTVATTMLSRRPGESDSSIVYDRDEDEEEVNWKVL